VIGGGSGEVRVDKIVSGKYVNRSIRAWAGQILTAPDAGPPLDVTDQIADYELVDENHRVVAGAVAAGAGLIVLGPLGLAGGLLAAKKRRVGLITWTDGTQSVVEIRDKTLHTRLMTLAASRRAERVTADVMAGESAVVAKSYRQCPFCAEEIRSEAIKCRFCGEAVTPATDPPAPLATGQHLGSHSILRCKECGASFTSGPAGACPRCGTPEQGSGS
jgi:hypothetical protein